MIRNKKLEFIAIAAIAVLVLLAVVSAASAASQTWYLSSTNGSNYIMYLGSNTGGTTDVGFSSLADHYWIANGSALQDITFPAGTWTLHARRGSGSNDRYFRWYIGVWDPGTSSFTGPDYENDALNGSWKNFYNNHGNLTVLEGQYLALWIHSTDDDYFSVDIDSGTSGSYLRSPSDSPTYPGVACDSAINVTKTEISSPPYHPGTNITYNITVCNIGNSSLTNVTLSDQLLGLVNFPLPALAIGECNYTEWNYPVTADDACRGWVNNMANVSAKDACNTTIYNQTWKNVSVTYVSALNVTKEVKDPVSETWVKDLTAKINDTLQFKSTITNTGEVNLTQIRFWDILDCSLVFEGDEYRFKPKVLHPNNEWDLGDPSGEYFTELCPSVGTQRHIGNWDDTNHDGNVSACDQVQLYTVPAWYHVDRVPYTLNLSNANGTTYFDSVLNWDDCGINLNDPNGTKWFGLCGCKDEYTLLNWTHLSCGTGLSPDDLVTMRNDQTLEEVQYTVEEVAKDLVVSQEVEVACLLNTSETITIKYNATVVRCGVDNNTFTAKGLGCGDTWTYSYPAVVTVTVPCAPPSGNATDPSGLAKEVYTLGEPVYGVGSGFGANKSVDIYIVPFQTLIDGVPINTLGILAGPVPVKTDINGSIPPTLVWPNPTQGHYLMVFDDPNGDYNQDRDPRDDFTVTGAVPLVTPLGMLALIGLLSIVATGTLVKKRKN